jgi:hypothetical protein
MSAILTSCVPCRAKLPNDPIKITLPDGTVKDGVKVVTSVAILSAQLDGVRGMRYCKWRDVDWNRDDAAQDNALRYCHEHF